MSEPSRYCRSCYTTNAWSAQVCRECGAPLGDDDGEDFDDRLIWALGHPDTATSERAAAILATRRVVRAVPALIATASSDDPYRAAAAARALLEFADRPGVQDELFKLRRNGPLLVRLAVGRPAVDQAARRGKRSRSPSRG